MKSRMFGIALVGVLLLGGCSPESEPTESPSPSATPRVSPSPLPSPSPSPTALASFPEPPQDEDPEVAAIREAWMAYEKLMFRYYTDPDFNDLNALNEVASGEEIHRATQVVLEFRERNLVSQGSRVVRDVRISSQAANADGVTIATVDFCADPTATTTSNTLTGELVVQPTKTLAATVTMELMPDGHWRAVLYRSELFPC